MDLQETRTKLALKESELAAAQARIEELELLLHGDTSEPFAKAPKIEINTSLSNGDLSTLAGFDVNFLLLLSDEWNVPVHHLLSAAIKLHTGLTQDQMCVIIKLVFGVKRSRSTIASWFTTVLGRVQELPQYFKPERRFLYALPLFPRATAIVDGVPVACRGTADYFNPKHGGKSVVFQVMCDLRGLPIAWNTGERGSTHDAVSFDAWKGVLPWHRCDEYFLADKAYSANPHCLTAAKVSRKEKETVEPESDEDDAKSNTDEEGSTDDEEDLAALEHDVNEGAEPSALMQNTRFSKLRDSTRKKLLFDAHHRNIRVRVEHLFARLNHHRWLSNAREATDNISDYFSLLLHLEARHMEIFTANHSYQVPAADEEWARWATVHTGDEQCTCHFVRAFYNQKKMTTLRQQISAGLKSYPKCRVPRKSAKGTERTYRSRNDVHQKQHQ